jgi:hypothetical protein
VNDRPDPTPTEDESSEIAEVRRLLADARHTEPMPEDVADRMNSLLDRLGDETPAAGSESSAADVIPITAHRRRRAAQLLVAAAAIVVGGVVITQNFSPSGDSGNTAGSQAQADRATGGRSAPSLSQSEQPERNYSTNEDSPGPNADGLRLRRGRVVVRSQHFTQDALRGRALLETSDSAAKAGQRSLLQDCPVSETSGEKVLAAEYRNAPAALIFRRPEGGTQVVDLVVCGSTAPMRTTTLPAP